MVTIDPDLPKIASSTELQQLIAMTNQMIPGDVHIEDSTDPEYPETPTILFRVAADLKPPSIIATIDKEIEWHRAARQIIPNATCQFALQIE